MALPALAMVAEGLRRRRGRMLGGAAGGALPDAHASVAHGGLCGPPCQPGPQRQDRQRPTSPRPQQQPRHHHCQLRALTVDPSPNDSGCNSWLGPASRSVSRHLQRPCHARPHPCHPAEPRKSPSRPVHPVHVLPKCHRNPCLSSRCLSECIGRLSPYTTLRHVVCRS